jgi:hypothetical protein
VQKAGLLLCALAFAFAPAGVAVASQNSGRTIEVERIAERGGEAAAWAFVVPPHVITAIENAAITTGADFEYLLKTAALESSFNEELEARTSSAAGLYQFVERTWLIMMHAHGAEAGRVVLASAVVQTKNGDCDVHQAGLRDEILELRHDAKLAALMAGTYARKNAERMARVLGRAPDASELYIGHFLGAAGGAKLIKLAERRPNDRASAHFRKAARANRAVFFHGRKPRTLREVRDYIAGKYAAILVRHVARTDVAAGSDLLVPAPIPRPRMLLASE